MTDPTVTPAEPADQPDHYAELAAELHRIADDLAKLAGAGLPKPWVSFGILPGDGPGDEEVTARVDAVAVALFGHPATTVTDGKGARRRQAYVRRGPVGCDVHELLSADVGMSYTRADTDADDPTPVSPARVPLHTGAMTDGGLVDETEPGVIVVADGHVVHECCGKLGDAAHQNFCAQYVIAEPMGGARR